jgi:nucleoside phosphorylase
MRILVTFAVDAEFAPWRRRHAFIRDEIAIPAPPMNRPCYERFAGNVYGNDVDVLLTGIGWEDWLTNIATPALSDLLKKKPDFCISTGLAGGLNRELRLGEIVAATRVILSRKDKKVFSHKRLLTIAEACGARVVSTMITETHIVGETSAKAALAAFGDCVEMESYYVLQSATGTQIPAIALRAISDDARHELPLDFHRILERNGAVKKRQLIGELVHHPLGLPGLIRFGWRSWRATHSLADFLDEFLLSLPDFDGRVAAAAYGEMATG